MPHDVDFFLSEVCVGPRTRPTGRTAPNGRQDFLLGTKASPDLELQPQHIYIYGIYMPCRQTPSTMGVRDRMQYHKWTKTGWNYNTAYRRIPAGKPHLQWALEREDALRNKDQNRLEFHPLHTVDSLQFNRINNGC